MSIFDETIDAIAGEEFTCERGRVVKTNTVFEAMENLRHFVELGEYISKVGLYNDDDFPYAKQLISQIREQENGRTE